MGSVADMRSEAGVEMTDTIIGIDPSSRTVAGMAWHDGEWHPYKVEAPKKLKERARVLEYLWEPVQTWLKEYTSVRTVWLFVEQPVVGRGGAHPTIVQAQVQGLVLVAAMSSGAANAYTVNVQTWKKDIVGKGNASKDDVASWLAAERPVLAELAGGDQDLVDAACLALYGRRVLARARR